MLSGASDKFRGFFFFERNVVSKISIWVNSNVGSKAEKEINGFTYEVSLGPVDNILYYAGEREWEEWELKQN